MTSIVPSHTALPQASLPTTHVHVRKNVQRRSDGARTILADSSCYTPCLPPLNYLQIPTHFTSLLTHIDRLGKLSSNPFCVGRLRVRRAAGCRRDSDAENLPRKGDISSSRELVLPPNEKATDISTDISKRCPNHAVFMDNMRDVDDGLVRRALAREKGASLGMMIRLSSWTLICHRTWTPDTARRALTPEKGASV